MINENKGFRRMCRMKISAVGERRRRGMKIGRGMRRRGKIVIHCKK
jgi:hypothetical protein